MRSTSTLTSKSTVFVGTQFEQRTMAVLHRLGVAGLRRTGGAGDLGVDIRGSLVLGGRGRVAVPLLGQCKCESTKVGPATIREFEGVLQREAVYSKESKEAAAAFIGVVASRKGFSSAAVDVFRTSRFALLLLTLDVDVRVPASTATVSLSLNQQARKNWPLLSAPELLLPSKDMEGNFWRSTLLWDGKRNFCPP